MIVAALGCLALGWWQWSRFQSAGGTGQNLGYALQWPLFAGFVVYAYRRFVRLEQESTDNADAPIRLVDPAKATEIPDGLLPPRPSGHRADHDRDDPVLAEYNRYLAELNARDEDRNL